MSTYQHQVGYQLKMRKGNAFGYSQLLDTIDRFNNYNVEPIVSICNLSVAVHAIVCLFAHASIQVRLRHMTNAIKGCECVSFVSRFVLWHLIVAFPGPLVVLFVCFCRCFFLCFFSF